MTLQLYDKPISITDIEEAQLLQDSWLYCVGNFGG